MADERPRLRVGGMQLLTTIDWEGRLAAIVFLQGCPWRCTYCHNRELTPPTAPGMTPWADTLDQLATRRGFLDAVIFSGGEPTSQGDLPGAIDEVAGLGFEVALHTNGFDPQSLARALDTGHLSFVAMDVKAPFAKYRDVTAIPASGKGASQSVELLIASGVEHEFRTTYHPALLSHGDLHEIARGLADHGASTWFIQKFRREGCPSPGLRDSVLLPPVIPEDMAAQFATMFERFGVREA